MKTNRKLNTNPQTSLNPAWIPTSKSPVGAGRRTARLALAFALLGAVPALAATGDVPPNIFQSEGNVGIGFAPQGAKLDVRGTVRASGTETLNGFSFVGLTTDGTFNNWLGSGASPNFVPLLGEGDRHGGFGMASGPNVLSPIVWFYSFEDRNCFQVRSVALAGDHVVPEGTPLFTVRQSGGQAMVGIGTEAPPYQLSVNTMAYVRGAGQSAWGLLIRGNSIETPDRNNDTDEIAINYAGYNSGYSRFRNFNVYNGKGGTVLFARGSDGYVGIGTTIPAAKLDVAGKVRCTTLELTSDRNVKRDFQPVAAREVLRKVAKLPLSTWAYTNEAGVRHLGPMAQDFHAAFGLGATNTHIGALDGLGVALAAIQGLNQKLAESLQEKDAALAALQRQVSELKQELAGVKDSVADRLAALEKAVAKGAVQQAGNDRPQPSPLTPLPSDGRGEPAQASFRPEATR